MKDRSMTEWSTNGSSSSSSSSSFGDGGGQMGPQARVAAATRAYRLTRRQSEVLLHLSSGQANKEIARALGCAEVTVESHMTQLLRKVGVDSRGQLISRFWSSF
jgi:DNA-binding NarL/FixJ family response regulator